MFLQESTKAKAFIMFVFSARFAFIVGILRKFKINKKYFGKHFIKNTTKAHSTVGRYRNI